MRLSTRTADAQFMPLSTLSYRTYCTGSSYGATDACQAGTPWSGTQKVTRSMESALSSFGKSSCQHSTAKVTGGVAWVDMNITDKEAQLGWNKAVSWFSGDHVERIKCRINTAMTCGFQPHDTTWKLEAWIPIELLEFITSNVVGLSQERADTNAAGTRPVLTRLHKMSQQDGLIAPSEAHFETGDILSGFRMYAGFNDITKLAYSSLVEFLAGAYCDSRLRIYGYSSPDNKIAPRTKSRTNEEDLQEEFNETTESPDIPNSLSPSRVTAAPDRALRSSVKRTEKDMAAIEDEIERGRKAGSMHPEADDDKAANKMSINVHIGPKIINVAASLDVKDTINEKSAVARHFAAETRPVLTTEAEVNLDLAAGVMKESIKQSFAGLPGPFECNLPLKWTEEIKDAVKEESDNERDHRLNAFLKSSEIGLDEAKRARMICTAGQKDAGANAQFVSPFEGGFKQCYPWFITKGLTTQETDRKVFMMMKCVKDNMTANRVFDNAVKASNGADWWPAGRHKEALVSIDFDAMDSTWTLKEKKLIVGIVQDCATVLMEKSVAEYTKSWDPILDAKKHKVKIEMLWSWIELETKDAILFSGERGTSIYNRLLVLCIRTAEIIRVYGIDEARVFWGTRLARTKATPKASEVDDGRHICPMYDIGDGDDEGMNTDAYADEQAMRTAYKAYGKSITVVFDYSCTKLEILSRYHASTKSGTYNVVKLKKNFQRCVMGCVGRHPLDEMGEGVATLKPAQTAEVATTLFYRAMAASQTMGLRWYAFHVACFQAARAKEAGHDVVEYDENSKRKFSQADQVFGELKQYHNTNESLTALETRVSDCLNNANVSSGVMVDWCMFGSKTNLNCKTFNIFKEEWKVFDDASRERVITADDFTNPGQLVEDLRISAAIAKIIGVSTKLMTCCYIRTPPQPSCSGATCSKESGIEGSGVTAVFTADKGGIAAKAEHPEPRAGCQHHGRATRATAPTVTGRTLLE